MRTSDEIIASQMEENKQIRLERLVKITTQERLEIKQLRQTQLRPQINADHKGAIKKINDIRAASGLPPIGATAPRE